MSNPPYPSIGIPSNSSRAGPSTTANTGEADRKPSVGKAPRKRPNRDEKEKKTRSRAACIACKQTKQRCDGPSRVPCRRCEIYGLECKFPPTANVIVAQAPKPPPATATPTENSAFVTQKLYEISARLQSIEAALQVDASPRPAESSRTPSRAGRSVSPESEDDPEEGTSVDGGRKRQNPLMMINQAIDEVVGPDEPVPIFMEDVATPDVLKRKVLGIKECQDMFDFFFASIHPWCMMLSLDEDRDAVLTHQRSPFLFHVILLLATAYSDPFPSTLHSTLLSYTNAIVAPQILNPQPHELTTDFLRAIDLLNLYKPVQMNARRAEGKNDTEAMRASKVNPLASWMLQGILGRTAERLELASTVPKFSRAYSTSKNVAEIPPSLLRDLRLYFWLLSNDVHGNVQSGRRCNMEGHSALAVTRIFSSLQLQPYDIRLAASVEMFEVARPILRTFSYERTRRISKADLERYNEGMASWEQYWLPILIRQQAVDPLALTVLCPFQWFITLTYNAAVYLSWKTTRRMYHSDPGPENEHKPRKIRLDADRELSDWEYQGLERCVKAAEGLVFTLCEESRVKDGWRAVQWDVAQQPDGWRKLTLDQIIVEHSSWGMDAITCIAYIFPLIFLSKLVNDGLLTVDLVLQRTPQRQQPWLYPRKLPRLLELGASFLDSISVNPHHPARSQAQVLRTVLDAGVRGVSPSPQLPRHAMTVLSSSSGALPMYAGDGSSTSGAGWPQDSTPALVTYQQQARHLAQLQQQQQLAQLQQQAQAGQSGGLGLPQTTPLDQSLNSVLNQFDPTLFGETSTFWEEPFPMGGTGDVDWNTMPTSL